MQDNLVPCSDMAGEIVAAGDDVKGWKVGDRVCANFALDHIHGDVTPAIQGTLFVAYSDMLRRLSPRTRYRSWCTTSRCFDRVQGRSRLCM